MSLCDKAHRLFSAYFEGELSDDQRSAFELHLQECARCQENYAAFRLVRRRLKEMPRPKPSPYFDAALFYRLRREQLEKPQQFAFPWKSWRPVPVFAAAAVFLILLGAQLQKSAMSRQLNEIAALNELLLRGHESAAHVVITQIDTTSKRLKVIKYVNLRPATADWENASVQIGRQDLSDQGGRDYPDLRQAPRPSVGTASPKSLNWNGARVIQASQYQF